MPRAAAETTIPAPASAPRKIFRRHMISATSTAAIASGALALVPTDTPAIAKHPDAELIALLAELDAVELAIYPLDYQGPERSQEAAEQNRRQAPLLARQHVLLGQVCAMRATTLEGMRARVRSIYAMGSDLTDGLQDEDDPGACPDERMVAALLRELAQPDSLPIAGTAKSPDAALLAACAHYERLEAAFRATGGTDADMVYPDGYYAASKAVAGLPAVTAHGQNAKACAVLAYYKGRDWPLESLGEGGSMLWSLVLDVAGESAA